MLFRLWLNLLSDSGSSLIPPHTTRSIYAGALTNKAPAGMLNRVPALAAYSSYTHCCSQLPKTMLKIPGPYYGTVHLVHNCSMGTTLAGTLSLRGVIFQPTCRVAKWPANGCLLFSSSRSAGNKSKRSGRSILNSSVDTPKKGQTKHQQLKDSLKVDLNDKSKRSGRSIINSAVDTTKRGQTKHQQLKNKLKVDLNDKSKRSGISILNSAVDTPKKGQAKHQQLKDSLKVDLNDSPSPKKGQAKHQQLKDSLRVDLSDSPSPKKGRTKHQKLKDSLKVDLNDSPSNGHVAVAETNKLISIGVSKDVREVATASNKQQTNRRDRSKINKGEKAKKIKLKREKVDEKPSSVSNDQQPSVSVMEATVCDMLQAKSRPMTQVVKGNQQKKKRLKTQTRDEEASGKLQEKSSPRAKVEKAAQTKKKKSTRQKKDEKASSKRSQVAPEHSFMDATVSVKLQSKSSLRAKVDKGYQPQKKKMRVKNGSTKQPQVAASEMSAIENTEVSQDAGERSVNYRSAQPKDTDKQKLPKADKELLVNTECNSDNEKEMNNKMKKITPAHAKGEVVVVVESETKAKTIQKYLGDKFVVLASYGHVRDLAPRTGSVRPNEGFIMIWEVPSTAWMHIKRIEGALSGAKSLVIASDPDREGEAIAWHIVEVLKQQGSLKKNMVVQRVVFHEVTESAIRNAIESPRAICMNLVNARHARSALDYLIGFSISPLLWRKLPGCQSAGRVQSAALSLICDREKEIEKFIPQEYWSVEAKAYICELPPSSRNSTVLAKVTHVDGKKLEKLSIKSQAEAEKVVQKVSSSNFKVLDLGRSTKKRNPSPPFITSTLQRDAANKLNFSATRTMKLAQELYEGLEISDNEVSGLITYMRTDGLRVSEEAAESIRLLVTESYGEDYAVKSIRKFTKKVKNAQEAHEAIRPTDIRRHPSMLANKLDKDLLKLYTLIWCQAMASQMMEAKINQISASFENEEKYVIFRSSGSAISFRGYLAVFQDNENLMAKGGEVQKKEEDGNFLYLSELKIGDRIYMNEVQPLQHFTEPLPRYSEGSLIEQLEELGIGRPSTYACTIKTLQAREYITIKGRQITPEFRGRMVSTFLSHYFSEIINYGFTAYMESQLDDISTGCSDWKSVLSKFWESFHPVCESVSNVATKEVSNMLAEAFGHYLFGALPEKTRACPLCKSGTLTFKVTRHGAGYFIGCSAYPQCSYIAGSLMAEDDNPEEMTPTFKPKLLGIDQDSKMQVFLKEGPYGYYVQLGEDVKGWKPKRASLSKRADVETIQLKDALELLRYPVILGKHPEDNKPVQLTRMRYGFAVRHRHIIATVPKGVDVGTVTVDMAIKYMKGKNTRMVGWEGQKKRRVRKSKVL